MKKMLPEARETVCCYAVAGSLVKLLPAFMWKIENVSNKLVYQIKFLSGISKTSTCVF